MTTKEKQTVASELEAIRRKHRGVLRPRNVVDAASDPENPLHDSFEWDDGKASDQYRLWQAREMIRVCVTVLPGSDDEINAYVSLWDDRAKPGGGYRALVDVLADKEARGRLLAQALAELKALERKYKQLHELAGVFAQAKKLRRRTG